MFNPKASQWFWNERFHKLVGFEGGIKNIRPVLDNHVFLPKSHLGWSLWNRWTFDCDSLARDILHRQLCVCFAQWRSHMEVFVAKQVFALENYISLSLRLGGFCELLEESTWGSLWGERFGLRVTTQALKTVIKGSRVALWSLGESSTGRAPCAPCCHWIGAVSCLGRLAGPGKECKVWSVYLISISVKKFTISCQKKSILRILSKFSQIAFAISLT